MHCPEKQYSSNQITAVGAVKVQIWICLAVAQLETVPERSSVVAHPRVSGRVFVICIHAPADTPFAKLVIIFHVWQGLRASFVQYLNLHRGPCILVQIVVRIPVVWFVHFVDS